MVDQPAESAREIAERTGRTIYTVRAWTRVDDFPAPVDVGPRNTHLYAPDAVDEWLAGHPAVAGPPAVDVTGDPDELLTRSQFATRIGKARGTVYQYDPPPLDEGGRARLGDLTAWWAARKGQGYRSDKD